MPRSFKLPALPANVTKDPRVVARLVLGILLLANLIAAFAIFRPVGGSAEQLDQELSEKRRQLQRDQAHLQRVRALAAKMEQARTSGDSFLQSYFMDRRTLSSTIVSELHQAAKNAGIKKSQHSFTIDPIEGSDTLSMVTIVGNYEGTYGDLLQFVNRLDKSGRFIIIDTMSAAPMQGSKDLAISVKMNTFVREDGVREDGPTA
jgi:type IV pilus assembly protein PilO